MNKANRIYPIPLFKNIQHQLDFENKGFVHLKGLFKNKVEWLLNSYQMFDRKHKELNIPFITTSHTNDAKTIENVNDIITEAVLPELDIIMQNYELIFGNYLLKMPVMNSMTNPHQDITFVNEAQFQSVNIWIALEDNDTKNGCMYFLEGSHRFFSGIRPTHIYVWPYQPYINKIFNQMKPFPSRAGDCFVFDHSILHASAANKGSKSRLAAVMAAHTKGAQLLHYFSPLGIESTYYEEYTMTKESFIHFEKEKPPKFGTYVKNVEVKQESISEIDLYNLLDFASVQRGTWINRLMHKLQLALNV